MEQWQPIALSLALVLAVFIVLQLIRRAKQRQLLYALREQDFAGLEQLLAKPSTKLLIPLYNLEYIRLNVLIAKGDRPGTDAQFDKLLQAKKSRVQTEDLLMKAFHYYLEAEDAKRCQDLLAQLKESGNTPVYEEAVLLYDVLLDHSSAHIDELTVRLEQAAPQEQVVYYYLLSKQYANAGDKQKAEEYERKAKAVLR